MTTRIDLETQLVAYSLQDDRGYAEAMALGVTPSSFLDPALRAIWSLIGALVSEEDMPAALKEVQGGIDAFIKVTSEVYRQSQAPSLAKVCARELMAANERSWHLSQIREIENILAKGWDKTAVANLHNDIAARLLENKEDKSVTRHEAVKRFIAQKKAPKGDPVRLALNVPVQDYHLRNVLAGELLVIAARNGHGKTAWALQVAQESAKLGTKVLYITAEMDIEELGGRMSSQETGINHRELRVQELDEWDEQKMTTENEKWAGRGINVEEMPRKVTGEQLCNSVRRAFMRGFKVVIVDYVGKVRGGKFNSRREEMEDLAISLKTEAHKGKGVVIALAQLNRAASTEKNNKEIDTAYIADSDAWGREADYVQFLSQQEDDKRVTHVSITKARHGETAKFALDFQGAIYRFVGEIKIEPQPKKGGW
jgi:replicative DNA helicase